MPGLPAGWVIENVPPDVWRHIFDICFPEDLLKDGIAPGSTNHTVDGQGPTRRQRRRGFVPPNSPGIPSTSPLILSHVCMTWRRIVFDAPQLWCHLEIQLKLPHLVTSPGYELRNLILKLSRDQPLSVAINCPPIFPRDITLPMSTRSHLSDVLQAHAHRIRDLFVYPQYFDANGRSYNYVLPGKGFKCLERLTLCGPAAGEHTRTPLQLGYSASPLWRSSPLLRVVVFRGALNFNYHSICGFPFHQLTTIEIEDAIFEEDLLAILSSTSSLAYCTVGMLLRPFFAPVQTADTDPPLKVVALPALRTLDLKKFYFRDERGEAEGRSERVPLQQFLHHLSCPALTTLCFRVDDQWSTDSLLSFVERSSCSLQSLTLDNIRNVTQDDLQTCLAALPSLVGLDLRARSGFPLPTSKKEYLYLSENLVLALQELTAEKNQFRICPVLRSLKVNWTSVGNCAAFADMIDARRREFPARGGPGHLEHVTITRTETQVQINRGGDEIRRIIGLTRKGFEVKDEVV